MVYVSMKNRSEWADVTPIPQNDGPNPVVLINYSEEFVEVMSYFRAVVALNEYSVRALELSKEVITRNGASCTGWNYRWKCLLELGLDLTEELKYLNDMSEKFPKNYQIWYHRRLVVGKLGADFALPELEVTSKVLSNDSKNYHAWSHRQWAVRTFGLWDEDFEYCNELIRQDVRNNSAWNQRYFILTRGGTEKERLAEVRDVEISFTIEKIRLATDNESSWNYLRGLACGAAISSIPAFKEAVMHIYEKSPKCIHALSLLADICAEEAQSEAMDDGLKILSKEKAKELWEQLVQQDPMRLRYWSWRIQMLD